MSTSLFNSYVYMQQYEYTLLVIFQVSWIRHRDLHILTVGKYLFTTDERFQALHKDGSDEWILFIKYAQIRDSGVYECQISTQPVRSIFINLNVVGKRSHLIISKFTL